tara:strand:- start:6380 stop:6610 length:231 start_codon:yes stop_codon:yes gene_type:complete
MIIPIKCFTCGKVLGDKYLFYIKKVKELKSAEGVTEEVVYLTENTTEKTAEGKTLDELGLNKICCRRHFLTHVDIL